MTTALKKSSVIQQRSLKKGEVMEMARTARRHSTAHISALNYQHQRMHKAARQAAIKQKQQELYKEMGIE